MTTYAVPAEPPGVLAVRSRRGERFTRRTRDGQADLWTNGDQSGTWEELIGEEGPLTADPPRVRAVFVGGPLHGTVREVEGTGTVFMAIPLARGDDEPSPVGVDTLQLPYVRRRFWGRPDIDPDQAMFLGWTMATDPNGPRYLRDVWVYGSVDSTSDRGVALVKDAVFRAWLRDGDKFDEGDPGWLGKWFGSET